MAVSATGGAGAQYITRTNQAGQLDEFGGPSWGGAQDKYGQSLQQYMRDAASGKNSVAQQQMQAGIGQAQQAMAQQAAGRGSNPLAQRAAIYGGGQMAQQAVTQSAALRAQEMQAAQAMQNQYYQQLAQGHMGYDQTAAQMAMADRGADLQERQQREVEAENERQFGMQMAGTMMQAAGGLAMSDERAKMALGGPGGAEDATIAALSPTAGEPGRTRYRQDYVPSDGRRYMVVGGGGRVGWTDDPFTFSDMGPRPVSVDQMEANMAARGNALADPAPPRYSVADLRNTPGIAQPPQTGGEKMQAAAGQMGSLIGGAIGGASGEDPYRIGQPQPHTRSSLSGADAAIDVLPREAGAGSMFSGIGRLVQPSGITLKSSVAPVAVSDARAKDLEVENQALRGALRAADSAGGVVAGAVRATPKPEASTPTYPSRAELLEHRDRQAGYRGAYDYVGSPAEREAALSLSDDEWSSARAAKAQIAKARALEQRDLRQRAMAALDARPPAEPPPERSLTRDEMLELRDYNDRLTKLRRHLASPAGRAENAALPDELWQPVRENLRAVDHARAVGLKERGAVSGRTTAPLSAEDAARLRASHRVAALDYAPSAPIGAPADEWRERRAGEDQAAYAASLSDADSKAEIASLRAQLAGRSEGASGVAAGDDMSRRAAADARAQQLAEQIGASDADMRRRMLDDVTDSAEGYTYRYKPEAQRELGVSPGQRYGIMAQDLERTPLGRTMVRDTPDGKMIDLPAATTANLAMTGRLGERQAALEQRLRELDEAMREQFVRR